MTMSLGDRREFIFAAAKARVIARARDAYADKCEHDIRRFNIPCAEIKLEGRPTKISVEAELQQMKKASEDLARIFQNGKRQPP